MSDVMVERAVWYWYDRELSTFKTLQAAESAVRRYARLGYSDRVELGYNGTAMTFTFDGILTPHSIALEQRPLSED